MRTMLYSEFAHSSHNHRDEPICGDSHILCRREDHTVAILSDGMGHGMRANILSTLTTSMLPNFAFSDTPPQRIAAMLDAMLPINRATGSSYDTFSLARIDNMTGEVVLMQYDNPRAIVLREGSPLEPEWTQPYVAGSKRPGKFSVASFTALPGDRLIMVTDGVTQSGQAGGLYRFGWGREGLSEFCSFLVCSNPCVSSQDMARQVVSRSSENDSGRPSDDMSCAVVTFRKPRRMLLVSCPPALTRDGARMADQVLGFEGEKVICGQPVASMIASQMGEVLERDDKHSGEAPVYRLRGFEMVTDGMIVPGRVLDLLEHTPAGSTEISGSGPAARIIRMMLRNDYIEFGIGMRRNIDPRGIVPDEFSVRRNILRRIIGLLTEKFAKTVIVKYY